VTPDGANPYFALEWPPRDTAGWHTLADLTTDRVLLRAKVTATANALNTDELRVAASIDHLGTSARIVSPLLRHVHTRGRVPQVSPHGVWWQPARPGPIRLAADLEAAPDAPQAVLDGIVRSLLAPLVAAYEVEYAVSPHVLWGNVASALNGARAAIASPGVDRLVRDLLRAGELSGTAAQLPPAFRRNSCCLLYRLPGRGLCGDCVLAATP
jgi:hypothetical protein